MIQIGLFIIIQFLILMVRNTIKQRYEFSYPEEYNLYFGCGFVLLLIVLGVLISRSDANVRAQIIKQVLNGMVIISLTCLGGCLQLLWYDTTMFQKIAYSFGGITVIKYFWPENQMKDEAINYIKTKYDKQIANFLDMNAIIGESRNDIDRLHENIDKAIVEKKAQMASWGYKFWDIFGLAGLTYSQSAGVIGACIGVYLVHTGLRLVIDYCLRKTINGIWDYVKVEHKTQEVLIENSTTLRSATEQVNLQQSEITASIVATNERITNVIKQLDIVRDETKMLASTDSQLVRSLMGSIENLVKNDTIRSQHIGMLKDSLSDIVRHDGENFRTLYGILNLVTLIGDEGLTESTRDFISHHAGRFMISLENTHHTTISKIRL